MKIDLTSTSWTLAFNGACIMQFSGRTAVSLGAPDDSSYIVYENNDMLNFDGQQSIYCKSLQDTGGYVMVEDIQAVQTSGAIVQEVPDITPATMGTYYEFDVASGDFITTQRSSNGQQFIEVSINPLQGDTQTLIRYKKSFKLPVYAEIEASLSQRTKGDYAVMEITDNDTTQVDTPTEFNITAISQSTTTLTVTIDADFDGWLGSWVDIYGLADNRFNYANLAVATISTNKRTLTFTTSDEATIPSLTVTPTATGGKIKRQAKLMSAANALGTRFTGTSATSSAYMARFGGGSIKEAGTLTGSRLITSASSAPTYTSGATGQVEIKATSRFRIDAKSENIVFNDKAIDSFASFTTRNIFSAVKPSNELDYYVRFRAVSPKSISKPIAKIVSIVKTGTTTATVTTDVAHGLNANSWVTIKGVRDITNFPNLTTATQVASIVNTTSFTIIIGGAVTATSYGGAVCSCNGSVDQQGAIAQNIQSIARDAAGYVTVVGNTTWAGLGGVGEYVNLYGVRADLTGADLGFDGVYKVHNFATTTLILEPVKDLYGNAVYNGSLTPVTPAGGVVSTTNCGGLIILRTTLRSHDFVLASYTQTSTSIEGQGTTRGDLSLPVNITSSSTLTVTANTTETALLAPSLGSLTTAATTNATSTKATAGTIYAVTISNTSASAIYLKLYNKASAPTVGTDVPLITIPIPATSAVVYEFGRVGIRFGTGIAFAVTGAIATADTTAVTAGSLVTISYI